MIWLPIAGDYADIDAYASILAYADLLNQRNKPAKTYIPIAPNYSVPNSLRLPKRENSVFNLQPEDSVIILDLSIPEAIHRLVPDSQILEIIDHHPGYEAYWKDRIGDKAIIEPIGAVATSIFEWWGECWDYAKMPPEIAKLLLAAILDNTLNFHAQITTDRDRNAAKHLARIINISLTNFTSWYFSEVAQTIHSNFQKALLEDHKLITLPHSSTRFEFYQLTLWDVTNPDRLYTKITKALQSESKPHLINVINLSKAHNYLHASTPELKAYFTNLLNLKPTGNWLISDRLYLRKEILSQMLSTQNS